jgi:hypothetical protein
MYPISFSSSADGEDRAELVELQLARRPKTGLFPLLYLLYLCPVFSALHPF